LNKRDSNDVAWCSVSSAERLTALHARDLVIATEAGDADASRTLVEAYLPAIAALGAEEAYEHVLDTIEIREVDRLREACPHAAPARRGAS
jgi:hypothetical protein